MCQSPDAWDAPRSVRLAGVADGTAFQAYGALRLDLFQLGAQGQHVVLQVFFFALQQGAAGTGQLQFGLHFPGQAVAEIQRRLHGAPLALFLPQLLAHGLQLILQDALFGLALPALFALRLFRLLQLLAQPGLDRPFFVDFEQRASFVGLRALLCQFYGLLQLSQVLGELFVLPAQLLLDGGLFIFQFFLAQRGMTQVLAQGGQFFAQVLDLLLLPGQGLFARLSCLLFSLQRFGGLLRLLLRLLYAFVRLGLIRLQFQAGLFQGLLPDFAQQFSRQGLQFFRNVGQVQPDPAFFPQILPESLQGLGGRTHAALAHQLIQLVGRGRDPVTEKQQSSHFPVQRLGMAEAFAQISDIGQHLAFGKRVWKHFQPVQGNLINNITYYIEFIMFCMLKFDISSIMSNIYHQAAHPSHKRRLRPCCRYIGRWPHGLLPRSRFHLFFIMNSPPLPPSPVRAHGISQLLARFDGRDGLNRALGGRAQIEAQTDIDALRGWLARYAGNPRTYANYRKEAERLLLWSVVERRKPLSSLSHEDIMAYRDFLADPQPAERWVIQGGGRPARHHPAWRPFAGPLSDASRNQAMLILNALFSWLVQAGYLAGNPLALSRQRGSARPARDVQRYLTAEQWRWVQDWIRALPEEDRTARRHKARLRWLFSVLYGGALRISELVQARMADVSARLDAQGREQWWLQVRGKGGKIRRVPMTQELMQELLRYRQAHGLEGPPHALEPQPLLMSAGASDKHLSRAMAHVLVKQVFVQAAQALRERHPEREAQARVLEQASAHWLRHSAGSHMANQGMDLRVIRDTLGHESIATTNIYLHADEEQRHRALEQAHHLGW